MDHNSRSAEDLRFSNYVTETAFSLSLTKAQVLELGLIGNEGKRYNGGRTIMALYSRGLITPDREDWSVVAKWELSNAGKALFDLLVVAGLVNRTRTPLTEAA